MLSESHHAATPQQPLEWHAADDLILRARRERDRWFGQVTRRAAGWLAGTGLSRFLRSTFGTGRRRAELRELLALDERTLRDIGLRRDDVLALAHGETTLERLNAERLGGARGALVELRSRTRNFADAPAEIARAA